MRRLRAVVGVFVFPKVYTCDNVFAAILFVRIYYLMLRLVLSADIFVNSGFTSRVEKCSILTFFAVIICTHTPDSTCRISMKLGSNAMI